MTPGGERFLDFVSGYGTTNTGHCHPRVVAAIRKQAGELLHVSTVGRTEVSSHYADRLCELLPVGEAKLFFTNSGTEAVEAALKLARYATGRPGILAFGGGFHGRTLGSLSVSSSKAAFRAGYEPLPGAVYTVPYPRESLDPTLAALERLWVEQVQPERLAAVIVEPVLGEGGYVVPPDGFLPALRTLCDEHGLLLVCDEVQSGFGRTGRFLACEHAGVEPDLVTLGKGIASGLPMGALAGRAELLDAWPPGAHGNTFGGNPVCCAAALATLEVIEDEGLVASAAGRGRELLEGLDRAGARAHGRGLMIGVDFEGAESTSRVRERLLEEHVIVSACGPQSDTLRLSPPLIITQAHVERFLAAFAAATA